MIKIVLDTNIFVSSIFWQGNPHKIIEKAIQGEIQVYVSWEILEELKKILKRDFDEQDNSIEEQIRLIERYAFIVEPNIRLDIVKDDPDDNKILECAIASEAEFIITGDKHLLNILNYEGITILSPSDFLKRIHP